MNTLQFASIEEANNAGYYIGALDEGSWTIAWRIRNTGEINGDGHDNEIVYDTTMNNVPEMTDDVVLNILNTALQNHYHIVGEGDDAVIVRDDEEEEEDEEAILRFKIHNIEQELKDMPKPGSLYDEDGDTIDDMYQAHLEYNAWRDEKRNEVGDLKEELERMQAQFIEEDNSSL